MAASDDNRPHASLHSAPVRQFVLVGRNVGAQQAGKLLNWHASCVSDRDALQGEGYAILGCVQRHEVDFLLIALPLNVGTDTNMSNAIPKRFANRCMEFCAQATRSNVPIVVFADRTTHEGWTSSTFDRLADGYGLRVTHHRLCRLSLSLTELPHGIQSKNGYRMATSFRHDQP